MEGETITEFEIETRDWEKVLKEDEDRIEKETLMRKKQLEKKEIKEKSWQLYRECKRFLEENDENWQKEKEKRDMERLQTSRIKQEKLRNKIKERKLEKDIEEGLRKIPPNLRKEMQETDERENRIEIIETKKNL